MSEQTKPAQTPAQRAADLPTPEAGKVVAVPLDLYQAYLVLHGLTEVRFHAGTMECKRTEAAQ